MSWYKKSQQRLLFYPWAKSPEDISEKIDPYTIKQGETNWYLKLVFSQGISSYLERLGASPEIINYISSQEKSFSQFLINEFRKNPNLTLEELQQIRTPEKIDPYLDSEKNRAKQFPDLEKWILVNFRKIRKGKTLLKDPYVLTPELTDVLTPEEMSLWDSFNLKLNEINDWFRFVHPNIFSYTAEQAIVASDEWHRTAAGKGEGLVYEPTKPENITYGPNWKNPDWDGWTIQKIKSENDLGVEGNNMNNCIGQYSSQVQSGESVIYSLRDPSNKPHVSMEINGDDGSVEQIQGNSNTEPKDEYKTMIKEWILSKKNPGIKSDRDPIEKLKEERYWTVDDMGDALDKVGKVDEYGFNYEFNPDPDDIAQDVISSHKDENRRDPEFSGDIVRIPELLIDATLKIPDEKEKIKKLKEFETYLWKISDEMWEYIDQNWYPGEGYPNEEDYETKKEFEQAEEEYEKWEQEEMDDWIKKTVEGGFAREGLDYLKKLREENIIPSVEEMHIQKEKVPELSI